MKLRVKHCTNEITVAEVIAQIFEEIRAEYLPKVFYYEEAIAKVFYYEEAIAMNHIDSAIKYVLGYDDDTDLNYIYEKNDLDVIRKKIYDIMYSIVQADKESE